MYGYSLPNIALLLLVSCLATVLYPSMVAGRVLLLLQSEIKFNTIYYASMLLHYIHAVSFRILLKCVPPD